MKKLLIAAVSLLGLVSCKKKEDIVKRKICYQCSGFPLNPDDTLDIGCYYSKQEAIDSVTIPEFGANEAAFDEHCKAK